MESTVYVQQSSVPFAIGERTLLAGTLNTLHSHRLDYPGSGFREARMSNQELARDAESDLLVPFNKWFRFPAGTSVAQRKVNEYPAGKLWLYLEVDIPVQKAQALSDLNEQFRSKGFAVTAGQGHYEGINFRGKEASGGVSVEQVGQGTKLRFFTHHEF